jgi:hypothetical protein
MRRKKDKVLKIKDDVDLKELEKFGFKKLKSEREYYLFNIDGSEFIEIIDNQIYLYINDEYYNCYTGEKTFDRLYDLIQAGLVEKINKEEER